MAARKLRIREGGWDGFDRRAANRRKFLRRFLVVALTAVLVGSAAAGTFWLVAKNRADSSYDRFAQALSAERYDDALSAYRDVQERALRDPSLFSFTDRYKESLDRMESLLDARVSSLFASLPSASGLAAEDLAFLDGMQEIASMLLSGLARTSCEAYLAGQGDIESVQAAMTQLLDVPSSKAAMAGLIDQVPAMVEARPAFVEADAALNDARWLDAAQDYLALVDGSTGFVREVAQARLASCRATMRDPVLQAIRVLMDGRRYYTALAELRILDRVLPDDADVASLLADCAANTTTDLEAWHGNFEYVAVRPLIADTAQAFDGDSYAQTAADAMLTTSEFRKVLEQLYARDYVLVDLPSLFSFTEQDGAVVAARSPLLLPKGKKPLVLGIEGLNYYAARHMTGNSVSLSIDGAGRVVSTYPYQDGTRTDGDGEAIGILEAFLDEHPDFSFNGARGTISLTGYECIFGAVTDEDQLDDRNAALQAFGEPAVDLGASQIAQNRQEVLAIIQNLKDHGWTFASSTYGSIDVSAATAARLTADTQKWQDQVETLTGPTEILVYPNGSWIPNSDKRMPILKNAGFRIYCGIGKTPYLNIGKDSVFIDRVLLNGYSLHHWDLSRLLDAAEVLDPARPAN